MLATASAATVINIVGLTVFFVISTRLAIVDWREHRLPNTLVATAAGVAIASQVTQTVITADPAPLLRSALTAAACFGVYLLLHLASRTKSGAGMGAGDVKLAGVLGLYLGWLSFDAAIFGIAAGFVLGALFSLILIAAKRGTRRSRVAFGPWMLAGAWLVLGASIAPHVVSLVTRFA